MSWSSSSALPRLGGALAASAALHATLVAGLDALPWAAPRAARDAVRLEVALQPAPEAKVEAPSPVPPLRQAAVAAPAPLPAPAPVAPYLLSKELDVKPAAQSHVQPAYPNDAYLRDITGRVVVRLFINEEGAVEKAVIVLAEPPGHFEEAVERAFLATRFSPGMKQGRPVKVQMVVEVRYDAPAAAAAK
ncbi:MAG TPA: energy transducer TonB [Burkholderiales bacterium]